MNIVLLEWGGGEGNPFAYFNSELKLRLEDFGCNVYIVDIEGELAQKLYLLDTEKGIHRVITHQGFGSKIRLKSNGKLIWDELKINLICLHSDHPSQAPSNHLPDSKYILHTYPFQSYVDYSNSMVEREYPAVLLSPPSFYKPNKKLFERKGDYFVFPKNIDPLQKTYAEWKSTLPSPVWALLNETADAIIDNYKNGDPITHHELIDQLLTHEKLEEFKNFIHSKNPDDFRFFVLQNMDKIYRNAASELVLEELNDIPLHINGRGWDMFVEKSSKYHKFSSFNELAKGDKQFYSNFGIIDIVPFKHSLHDRTLRAISHQCGFLSNSGILFYDSNGMPYSSLFFNGFKGSLRAKAEVVINSPDEHYDRCQQFGIDLELRNPFDKFFEFLYSNISH